MSELELTLGDVAMAVADAEQSVAHADRSGDAFWRMASRAKVADALHQAGRRPEAGERFREAEALQAGMAAAVSAAVLAPGLSGLRASGQDDDLPRGLLTHAWLRAVEGDAAHAKADLDEAQRIAERGSMRLHLADVHLHRARLFRDRRALASARRLIEECGYHRRDEELRDAEEAARSWGVA